MLTKKGLASGFNAKWNEHYNVELFKQKGFMRKECSHCKAHFWTLDPDRKTCGSPPCDNYGFIGQPITKVKWDYISTWKSFEKFFKKNAHNSMPRYPVIDRWRPDLYFTIASIQDFQRIDNGNVVMEYPADPLIVPQVCLRFNDISNVGVTGRHHTSFIMAGQHSFGNYWKDRTIELNFGFLNGVMGIPEKELTYVEDVWSMPDFSQFGPSLETFSRGLELVNSVFSQFTATSGGRYKEMPQKVVDVGWGYERLAWFSTGTTTGYDTAFAPVIEWMKKKVDIKGENLFERYSVLAGSLTVDEVDDITAMRSRVANDLGVSVKDLNAIVEPMQAMYAIADHAKTMLFAVSDGGIPSNVGGGYDLRVILRRALSFIEENKFDFDLNDIANIFVKQLRPMFPELKEGLSPLANVLDVEKRRYQTTAKKSISIVRKELTKGIDEPALARLYTSNGISPEDVAKIAKEDGKEFNIPDDIYSTITAQHMAGKKEKQDDDIKVDVLGIPETKLEYYEKPYEQEFRAKVLKVDREWVMLDKTLFYPEGGGQPGDAGTFSADGESLKVTDTKKVSGVVIHRVKGNKLKKGDWVKGKIDWQKRYALMKMHSSTHVLAGVTRKILGNHIWQAGAHKSQKSSRIDLTHYERFSQEVLEEIEKEVNAAISKGIRISAKFMGRSEAESKYGFVLYQGGASPGKEVRVVSVSGLDVEACGGMHLANTKEIGNFKIIKSERIQDGVNRIEFATSGAADEFLDNEKALYEDVMSRISQIGGQYPAIKNPEDFSKELLLSAEVFSVEPKALPSALEKFGKEIAQMQEQIGKLSDGFSLEVGKDAVFSKTPPSLSESCSMVFSFWKGLKKESERMISERAKLESEQLMKKMVNSNIFEIVSADRKELIEIASRIVEKDPEITVILANQAGDIIGVSRTEDMGEKIKDICTKSGGTGGGRRDFAQGRVELSKLIKSMKTD